MDELRASHYVTRCSHLPEKMSVTCQSKHAERTHAKRMGVTDLITLALIGRPSKNVGLQFGEISATFVGECLSASVNRR